MPKIEGVSTSAKLKINRKQFMKFDEEVRRPMKVNLGCALVGAANPSPDTGHPHTALRGAIKRFIREIPKPDPAKWKRFQQHVREFARTRRRLDKNTDVSTRTWLDGANYPQKRKEQLWNTYISIQKDPNMKMSPEFFKPEYTRVKSFIKEESYPQYKHARPINSREDAFKTAIGPWFKVIEKEIFQMPEFIKKIPRHDWPDYVSEFLGKNGCFYLESDYTAYESHFCVELMQLEAEIYKWMTQDIPGHEEFHRLLDEVIAGKNVCVFKYFTIICMGRRMSGEMNTSLGNGIMNYLITTFVMKEAGCTNVKGVYEGDDGLITATGVPPTVDDYASIGITATLKVHKSIETASFCGMVFDQEDRRNLCDPIDVLLEFGWTNSRYSRAGRAKKLQLLKAKSLSLLYQYPGCPVVSSLAKYGLRVTRGVRIGNVVDSMNMWEREQLLQALKHRAVYDVPVGRNSRMVVEEVFGLRIEHQLDIEKYLDTLDELVPLEIPYLDIYMHKHQIDFYKSYQAVGGTVDRPVLNLSVKVGESLLPHLDGTRETAESLRGL